MRLIIDGFKDRDQLESYLSWLYTIDKSNPQGVDCYFDSPQDIPIIDDHYEVGNDKVVATLATRDDD